MAVAFAADLGRRLGAASTKCRVGGCRCKQQTGRQRRVVWLVCACSSTRAALLLAKLCAVERSVGDRGLG